MPVRRVLIVEDEVIIAQHLRSILHRLGCEVVAVASRVSEALHWLQQHPVPDMVMVDVMLRGELDGIDLAHRLRTTYAVPFVFTTSLTDAATVARAKHTHPHGYLIKPFNEQDVYVALELAFANFAAEHPAPPTPRPPAEAPAEAASDVLHDSIFVRDRKQLTRVSFADLVWLEAAGNYTLLHTRQAKYSVSHPLKQIEERLPAAAFVRVHKSYIVALNMISALDAQGLVVDGTSIPVGRAYHANLMRRLNLLAP